MTLFPTVTAASAEDGGVGSVERSGVPGRQPWDPANGLRVGVAVGALLGGAVVAVTGPHLSVVAAGAAVGGAIGLWSEKRKQRQPDGSGPDRSADR